MKMHLLLCFVVCVAHAHAHASASPWSTVNRAGGWGSETSEAGRFEPHHASRWASMAAAAAAATADPHVKWTYDPYDLQYGPSKWHTMPDWGTCAGTSQSPVSLSTFVEAQLDADNTLQKLAPKYRSAPPDTLYLSNTGHALQVNMPAAIYEASWLRGGALGENQYQVVQLHMHARSEHSVGGAHYPLEIHIVHNRSNSLAVVGIMVRESSDGTNNTALKPLTDLLPHFNTSLNIVGTSIRITQRFDLYNLFPTNLDYYHYNGSLTTPPCTEQVVWHVLANPISASRDQILALTAPFGNVGNSRPTQPLYGRKVPSFKKELATGRYVRIEAPINTTTPLNIAEVHVFDMYRVNVAFNKAVTMSSQYSTFDGKFLVDGITYNFAHTKNEVSPFMIIDLGSVIKISKITIFNRVDECCQDRLVGSVVQVRTTLTGTEPYWTSSPLTSAVQQNAQKPVLATGRYVRIQKPSTTNSILNIAEVEVYDMNDVNVALNKAVNMSSTWTPFEGSNLVDGIFDNFAHTNSQTSPYMSIDLGSVIKISRITIFNRVGCCEERLVGSVVQVRTTQNGTEPYWTSNPLTAAGQQNAQKPVLATGRYVRIQKPSATNTILNIAEVEVFNMYDENVAFNKSVTMSSVFQQFHGGLLVDGRLDFFAHTDNKPNPWMIIDLGSVIQISKITVFNRRDACCVDRLVGSVVQVITDTETGPYWTSSLLTSDLEQHFRG